MLAFEVDGTVFVRRGSTAFSIEGDSIISQWSPLPGIEVETRIVAEAEGHLRIHRIRSGIGCTAYDASRKKN